MVAPTAERVVEPLPKRLGIGGGVGLELEVTEPGVVELDEGSVPTGER